MTLAPLALLVALGCQPPKTFTPAEQAQARRVLLVVNKASRDSQEVGAHYRAKRGIPAENVVTIDVSPAEDVPLLDYVKKIEDPVKVAINGSKSRIDFIVLTKGVPIRLGGPGGRSVDALLASYRLDFKAMDNPDQESIKRSISPYFNRNEPFDSSKFNMFLVTRLDGYTAADAKRLVDNALAAKEEDGLFFFDQAGNRTDAGYGELNSALATADGTLNARGFNSRLEATSAFVAPSQPLMGYASWGSNDADFGLETYRKLRFKPGAIAETFVSTSARTFERVEGGQSVITDLIAQGVTGVKGYVSEPFTFALARPEILFDRYTRGYNLAESFYMASLVAKWKDVVIGDPLCRPYPQKR